MMVQRIQRKHSFLLSRSLVKSTMPTKKIEGRSAARNHGIQRAQGETLIFIDDDCVPAPTFIESHIRNHLKDDKSVVLGYKYKTFSQMLSANSHRKRLLMETLNRYESLHPLKHVPVNTMLIHPQDFTDGFDRIIQLSYAGERERWEKVYSTYTPQLEGFVIPWLLFTTGNISVSKRHCVEIGGFDEGFKGWGLEDFEMGYRLYKQRLSFVLDKSPCNLPLNTLGQCKRGSCRKQS